MNKPPCKIVKIYHEMKLLIHSSVGCSVVFLQNFLGEIRYTKTKSFNADSSDNLPLKIKVKFKGIVPLKMKTI